MKIYSQISIKSNPQIAQWLETFKKYLYIFQRNNSSRFFICGKLEIIQTIVV